MCDKVWRNISEIQLIEIKFISKAWFGQTFLCTEPNIDLGQLE